MSTIEIPTQRINNIICGPQIDIATDGRGLGRRIFDKLQEYEERIFQIDVDNHKEETFKEVNKKCISIALEMRKRGINKDDIIMVCSGNNMDALLPIFSTLYLNAITSSIDPSLSIRGCVHLLKMVTPKLIFVVPNSVEFVENILVELDIKPEIIVMGPSEKYSTLSDFLRPHPEEDAFVPDYVGDVHDTAVIFFSSGTTGLPKGICCSNYSMINAADFLRVSAVDPSTILTYTSFFWVSAFVITISGVLAGGKRLVVPKFTPESFLKYAEKHKLTLVFLPSAYALQFNEENTKHFENTSLTDIRIGGSVIGGDNVQNLRKYFPNTGIYILYGLTEGGGIVSSFTKFSDSLSRVKHGSCGVPYINTKIKIADLETRKTLGPHEKGEICVKCESAFTEYYHQDSKDAFDEEGFLRTGDVGYYDEDNCLYFSDRTKEMFKYQGWHITPASIEIVLLEHPAVSETIVVGIPHELDDHHPLGLIVLKEGHNITEKDILNFVNAKVLDREKLRAGLMIVKKFPKTSTGKISRQVVRQMVLTGNTDELNSI